MSVETEENRASYGCDGIQTQFLFKGPIKYTSDLKVYCKDSDGERHDLIENSDYTISPNGASYDNGCIVTTSEVYASGNTLILYRDLPIIQPLDYAEGGKRSAEEDEDALDRVYMILQQFKEKLGRTLFLGVISSYSELELPDPAADMLLAWKDDLTGLKNVTGANIGDLIVSDWIKNLLDDADAAAARRTLKTVGYDLIVQTNADLELLQSGDATPYNSVFIQHGSYTTSEKLDLHAHGVKYLCGETSDTKIIFNTSNDDNNFLTLDDDTLMENLTIEVTCAKYSSATNIIAPYTQSSNNAKCRNVYVYASGSGIKEHYGFSHVRGGLEFCSSQYMYWGGFKSCFNLVGCEDLGGGVIGFYDCMRLTDCKVYDSDGVGFSYCHELSACFAEDCTDEGFSYCESLSACRATGCGVDSEDGGFNNCKVLSGCRAVSCSYDGFKACSQLSACHAENNTSYGFAICSQMSSCDSKDDTLDGFYACTQISACRAYGAGGNGFDSCQEMAGCMANTCGGNGFDTCARVSASQSISNTGYGFESCLFMAACYADGNTGGNWNACTVKICDASCNNT